MVLIGEDGGYASPTFQSLFKFTFSAVFLPRRQYGRQYAHNYRSSGNFATEHTTASPSQANFGFDWERPLRNLARLYKVGLLTAQIVKKFEFPKSKMADGRHFENR